MNSTPLINPAANRVDFYMAWVVLMLFFFSAFSIAGINASIICLFGLMLYRAYLKLPYPRLAVWVWVTFLCLPVYYLLNAFFQDNTLEIVQALKSEYRMFLPLALLPALASLNLTRGFRLLAVMAILVSLLGVFQFFFGYPGWLNTNGTKLQYAFGDYYRATGNFSTPLTYSGYLLVLAPFFFMVGLYTQGRDRSLFLIASVLSTLGVVLSLSRSGWIGLVFASAVLMLHLPRLLRMVLLGGGILLLVGILGVGLWKGEALYNNPDTPLLIKRLMTPPKEELRLLIWNKHWMIVQDHFWGGVGFDNDNAQIPYNSQITVPIDKLKDWDAISPAHNMYLQVWAYLGLPGLLVYLSFWAGVMTWTLRKLRDNTLAPLQTGVLWGALAGMVGSLVAGFFENNFYDAEVQAMVMMMVGLTLYISQNSTPHHDAFGGIGSR
ncbi:MAG: O-antigen ligase family protein [Deltaproteobacteria bacterium]|nr:O-antigen ligase family protein [Deltaproteobacteria bacterium]